MRPVFYDGNGLKKKLKKDREERLVRETLRYLSVRDSGNADEELKEKIRKCLSILQKTCTPKHVYRIFPISVEGQGKESRVCTEGGSEGCPSLPHVPESCRVLIGDAVFESRDLSYNLSGCTKAALLSCTLGEEADRLIRRAQVTSMADAAVYQAACAAWIEDYTDGVNAGISEEAEKAGFLTRPRYSPGYGDLKLESQRDFFRLLNVNKAIGVTLTEGLLMVPEKTVTAFIGFCPKKETEDRPAPEKEAKDKTAPEKETEDKTAPERAPLA